MTDQELTKIIAEKVMGYTDPEPYETWEGETWFLWDKHNRACKSPFFPLSNDYVCMAAWDNFITHKVPQMSSDLQRKITEAISDIMMNEVGSDRRRSMCECITKAMEETS